jgi:hypothetical protein
MAAVVLFSSLLSFAVCFNSFALLFPSLCFSASLILLYLCHLVLSHPTVRFSLPPSLFSISSPSLPRPPLYSSRL